MEKTETRPRLSPRLQAFREHIERCLAREAERIAQAEEHLWALYSGVYVQLAPQRDGKGVRR